MGPPPPQLDQPQLHLYSIHASPLSRRLLEELHAEGVQARHLLRPKEQGGAARRYGIEDLFGRRFVGSAGHMDENGNRIDPRSGRPWPFRLGSDWNNAVTLVVCWETASVLDEDALLDGGAVEQDTQPSAGRPCFVDSEILPWRCPVDKAVCACLIVVRVLVLVT